jgi:hypothetical protein
MKRLRRKAGSPEKPQAKVRTFNIKGAPPGSDLKCEQKIWKAIHKDLEKL